MVPLTVRDGVACARVYGTTTVFRVWNSIPGVLVSSNCSSAECAPTDLALTRTGSETSVFSGSITLPVVTKVPSPLSQDSLYFTVPAGPEVRRSVYVRVYSNPGRRPRGR